MSTRWLGTFVISLLVCVVTAAADVAIPTPTLRLTNDRDHDLLSALIRASRFDDALQVCKARSQRIAPQTEIAAKWAIRQSQVLTAMELGGHSFADAEIVAASKPVADLLAAYPKHNRAIFLEAQRAEVRKQAAIHQVVQAAISPSEDTKIAASTSLVQVVTESRELMKQIADLRSELHRQPSAIDELDSDLNRLHLSLSVKVVSLILAQTELFPRDSDDRIAAAAKAELAAREAINRTSTEAPARAEIQRLKVEAILRSGQPLRAAAEFDAAFSGRIERLAPRLRALQISIQLANDDQVGAKSMLSGFFGDDPNAAPRSIEMDLIRLEYLLRFRADQVGSWFDAVERRGGRYARRRAESIALSVVGVGGAKPGINPALLAAEGHHWLRRGEPIRAAELLSAAANADNDGERSIRRATEAAAAFAKAGNLMLAATTLIDAANANRQSAAAAAAHLQAIYLLRSSGSKRVEELLREQIDQWPNGTVAVSARGWLYKHFRDNQRFLEAADVVCDVKADDLIEADLVTIANAWRTVFHQSDDLSLVIPSQRFQQAMKPLLASPVVKERYREIASVLVNREFLAGLPGRPSDDPFINALVSFRKGGSVTPELLSVRSDHAGDARWRLIRDGRALPQRRASIAELLGRWDSQSEPTFEQAELALWSSEFAESIRIVQSLVKASRRDVDTMKQAATLLGFANNSEARREAIRFWDEIASGTRKGNPVWHEAKLAAIGLLRKSGNHDAANRRTKYILLTMPSMDANLTQKYESVTP